MLAEVEFQSMKVPAFDLSKAPHRKSIDLVVPLLPGIFFWISICFGRTDLQQYLGQRISHLGHYTTIAIALFCAYFMGLMFVMATLLVQSATKSVLFKVFRLKGDLPRRVLEALHRRQRPENWFDKKFKLSLLNRYTRINIQREHRLSLAYNVWVAAARRQLKQYGISPPEGLNADDRWGAWFSVLGLPRVEEFKGGSLVRAMYAAGWSATAVLVYAPALRKSYYICITLLLLTIGFMHDLNLASYWANPISEDINLTTNILRELRRDNLRDTHDRVDNGSESDDDDD